MSGACVCVFLKLTTLSVHADTDITVTDAGVDANPTLGGFIGQIFGGGSNDNATIKIGSGQGDTNDTLLKQLANGNTTISTVSTGTSLGDITVADTLSYNSSSSFTLNAAHVLTINSAITNTDALSSIFLTAGSTIALNANLSAASIALNHTSELSQTSGKLVSATTALTLSGSGDVGANGSPLSFSAPSVTLNKAAGDAYLSAAPGGTSVSGSTGGTLALNADGDITQAAALSVTGSTKLDAGAHNIVLTNAGNDFGGAVALSNTAGDVSITDANSLELDTSSVGGDLTIHTTGAITQAASSTLTVSGASSFSSGANPITLAESGNSFTGAVSLSNSGQNNAAVKSSSALIMGASSVGGDLSLDAGGSIAQSESTALVVGGATTFTASGSITLNNSENDFNSVAITTTNEGNAAVADANNVTISSASVAGALSVTTPDGATFGDDVNAGSLSVTGPTTIGASAISTTSTQIYDGALTLTTSPVLTSSNAGIAISSIGVGGNHALTIDAAGQSTLGSTSGLSSLTKKGAGTLELTGANNYGGGTTIDDGMLELSSGGTLAPGGDVTINNSGIFSVGNDVTIRGLYGSSATAGVELQNGRKLTINLPKGSSSDFAGTIAGYGSVTLEKNGPGTFVFTGTASASPYTQPASHEGFGQNLVWPQSDFPGHFQLDVKSGTFQLGDSDASDYGEIAGDIFIDAPATFIYDTAGNSEASLYSTPTGTGTFRKQGAENLTLNGSFNGKVSVDAGTLTIGTSLTVGSLEGNGTTAIASDSALTVAGTFGDKNYDGTITGGGALTKAGSSTLTLAEANDYQGGTTISSGSLKMGANGALPTWWEGDSHVSGDVTINGTNGPATLDLNGTTQSVGSLTLGGAGASTFATNSVVFGQGTLTLVGNVTYDATNSPASAILADVSPFSHYEPRGGTLALRAGDHAFVIGDSGNAPADLAIYATLANADEAPASITKTGAGSLLLAGTKNTTDKVFSGGVTVGEGRLLVASNDAAGSGTLLVQGGATLAASSTFSSVITESDDPVVLSNAVAFANGAKIGVSDKFSKSLGLTGPVTLPNGTVHLVGDEITWLAGTIDSGEASAVTFDSSNRTEVGKIILAGSTTANLASVTASQAAVLVANTAALGPTFRATSGYVGVAQTNLDINAPAPIALRLKIDPANFSGTFGFDTDLDNLAPYTFSVDGLNFSAFNGAAFTLGSLTAAKITGGFTPPSTGYTFGNGGGKLFVESDLTGDYPVTVNSTTDFADNALTVVFQGNNGYTGNLTVSNSAVILDSPHALPEVTPVVLNSNSYFGHTENYAGDFATFFSRVAPEGAPISYFSDSILGIDSANYLAKELDPEFSDATTRVVGSKIDLSGFGPVYLGTATSVVLSGPILAPNAAETSANQTLRLTAIDGGTLTVKSALTSDNVAQVVIGLSSNVLENGTVVLAGDNTYAGGTTLLGGSLLVSRSSKADGSSVMSGPLGTGTLVVSANNTPPVLAQNADHGDVVLHNPIEVDGPLQVGSAKSTHDDYDSYSSHWLILEGPISGEGSLTVVDDTLLDASNTFSGGVTLLNGKLGIGNNDALGTGTLVVQPSFINNHSSYATLYAQNGNHTIENAATFNFSSGASFLHIVGSGSLTFAGPVSLSGNGYFYTGSKPLYFTGAVGGSGRLQTIGGTVVLSGSNGYTGGTEAVEGAIIFSNAGAIPNNPNLTADGNGYIGLATPTGEVSLQSAFINKFNHSSSGTIGFDTLNSGTNTFSNSIDLSSFGTSSLVRLGSATHAILSGTITPSGGEYYRFGGGGGSLEVSSVLADGGNGRALRVDSPSSAPLTLRLASTPAYVGGTDVTNSALIFTVTADLPPGTTNFSLNTGGYIGREIASSLSGSTSAITNLLGRFPADSGSSGYIGFDSADASNFTVSDLSLGSFTDGGFGVATTTKLTLAGSFTPPSDTTTAPYRFAGYKGGQLTVESPLVDEGANARSVLIGDPDIPATAGSPLNPDGTPSSVTLTGNNTYTGGTKLYAGRLVVGQSNGTIGTNATTALGTGTLSVEQNHNYGMKNAVLAPAQSGVKVSNALTLKKDLTVDVDLDGAGEFTLTGALSSVGEEIDHVTTFPELYKTGGGTLRLSGTNTSQGDIYVSEGNVTFVTANSVGLGALRLGYSSSSSAEFLENSTVYGIYGDNSSQLISFANNNDLNPRLTIDQQFDSHYAGQFVGSGTLIFQNTSGSSMPTELVITNTNPSFTGAVAFGTNISVVTASSNAFPHASGVALNGGRLALEDSAVLDNFTLSSGTLAGTGTFKPASTLTIGGSVTLAPGFSPGTMHFDGSVVGTSDTLTLAGGGTYEWELNDANNAGGWDKIDVNGSVSVTATSLSKFDFKLIPLAANFDMAATYAWTVLTASGGITGWDGVDQTKFNLIKTGSFTDAVSAGGSFSLSLGNANHDLILNFNPAAVPEPSTWALLIAGLGVIGFVTLRRKR